MRRAQEGEYCEHPSVRSLLRFDEQLEPKEDLPDVRLYSSDRDRQALCDRRIRVPFRDERENLQLARTEAAERSAGPPTIDECLYDRLIDDAFTLRNAFEGVDERGP